MPSRDLYLAAYDISNPRCLAAALKRIRAFATGGQKSLHEVYLTPAERNALLDDMHSLIDSDCDRFLLIRLDSRSRTCTLGKAVQPAGTDYFYVG